MQTRQWYSPEELADLKLNGFYRTKREVNKHARRERWEGAYDERGAPLCRRRGGRGGGFEYHSSLLPAAARADLARRGLAPAPSSFADLDASEDDNAVAQQWQWLARQSESVRAEAYRRAAIVARVDAFEASGMSRTAAVMAVAGSDCPKGI